MSYTHLSIEERACIAEYYARKLSISQIARLLGRSKSTISRELRRNPSRDYGYNAVGAQAKYRKRRKRCIRTYVLEKVKSLVEYIQFGLDNYWSPEQIVNTLPQGLKISISSIYRALDKGRIPLSYKKKLRRYGKHLKKKKAKGFCYDFSNVRTIDQRPTSIENREDFGHWELDTIVLRPECGFHLATFVERKSRFLFLAKSPDKKAKNMSNTIIETFKNLPKSMLKTLTVDRGLEFTDWQTVEEALGVKVYFCDPYKPCLRGTNENTNGLIRQFFPRKQIFTDETSPDISFVQNLLNNRPRKCLAWDSPIKAICCT